MNEHFHHFLLGVVVTLGIEVLIGLAVYALFCWGMKGFSG